MTAGADVLARRFQVEQPLFEIPPRFNVAPTQEVPVILLGTSGPVLRRLRWGLVPSWAKDAKNAAKRINARSETIAEKPSFRGPFARSRCLVPADGFFEWRLVGAAKTPARIVLKSRALFAFAGLWDEWSPPEGPPLRTFTILTTEATPPLRALHARMPVLLAPEDERAWLDPGAPRERLAGLLKPYPGDRFAIYEVSPAVNSPKADGPECIEPVTANDRFQEDLPGMQA